MVHVGLVDWPTVGLTETPGAAPVVNVYDEEMDRALPAVSVAVTVKVYVPLTVRVGLYDVVHAGVVVVVPSLKAQVTVAASGSALKVQDGVVLVPDEGGSAVNLTPGGTLSNAYGAAGDTSVPSTAVGVPLVVLVVPSDCSTVVLVVVVSTACTKKV